MRVPRKHHGGGGQTLVEDDDVLGRVVAVGRREEVALRVRVAGQQEFGQTLVPADRLRQQRHQLRLARADRLGVGQRQQLAEFGVAQRRRRRRRLQPLPQRVPSAVHAGHVGDGADQLFGLLRLLRHARLHVLLLSSAAAPSVFRTPNKYFTGRSTQKKKWGNRKLHLLSEVAQVVDDFLADEHGRAHGRVFDGAGRRRRAGQRRRRRRSGRRRRRCRRRRRHRRRRRRRRRRRLLLGYRRQIQWRLRRRHCTQTGVTMRHKEKYKNTKNSQQNKAKRPIIWFNNEIFHHEIFYSTEFLLLKWEIQFDRTYLC